MIRLYSYWRSSSSYRVRIALELKRVAYELVPVHLVRNGGEQRRDAYRSMNPQQYVPLLEDGATRISQSLAIIDYLEALAPDPALLPEQPASRAAVLSFAQTIASDIQPLQNLSVLQYLTDELGHAPAMRQQWSAHWIDRGLQSLESQLAACAPFTCCFSDEPGLADVCLVPQMYNAERFGVDLERMPRLVRITRHLRALPAFQRAHPDHQPDAE